MILLLRHVQCFLCTDSPLFHLLLFRVHHGAYMKDQYLVCLLSRNLCRFNYMRWIMLILGCTNVMNSKQHQILYTYLGPWENLILIQWSTHYRMKRERPHNVYLFPGVPQLLDILIVLNNSVLPYFYDLFFHLI